MAHQQAKIIAAENTQQQATFLNCRAELLRKAEELSALCGVPVVVVTQGPGEAGPTVWPAGQDAMNMLQRFAAMADDASSVRRVIDEDYEEILRRRVEELTKAVDSDKAANREREINLVLSELVLGRRRVDDLPAELAGDVRAALEMRLKAAAERMDFLCPEGTAAAAPAAGKGMDAAAMDMDGNIRD